jgi:choline kinase
LIDSRDTQIIVVDFEYAGPNPAAFDIANHFHEWTANYHSPNPHILTGSYPTREERWNFYLGYFGSPVLGGPLAASPAPTKRPSFHRNGSSSSINSSSLSFSDHHGSNTPKSSTSSSSGLFSIDSATSSGQAELEDAINILDAQVHAWSPASHAMWIVWGIVQASDDVINGAINDFDYLGYAAGRLDKFYGDLVQRGVKW